MDKIAYVVTAAAGPKVAGRRVLPGEELLLTEFEARAELLAGSLTERESIGPLVDAGSTAAEPAPKKR